MSVDMGNFIAPKSDQLNADDLIAGPRTIKITGVRANEGSAEQPISISFEGDNGKPYKPCKSMRRVMVYVWGADASTYIGRSMTVYCDPDVQFGGMKVGGIRISHMSHIDAPRTMPLTATRARRAPFTVQPLAVVTRKTDAAASPPTVDDYAACRDLAALEQLEQRRKEHWKKVPTDDKPRLKEAADAAATRLNTNATSSLGPNVGGLPLDFDAAKTEADLRASKTAAQLNRTWAIVTQHYGSAEIPIELDAAYTDMKHHFEGT